MENSLSYEMGFWGDCASTYWEEGKQLVAAQRMGLRADWDCGRPPEFDVQERSIIDIGGGPVSLLLKCRNRSRAVVVDPGDFPLWVGDRYRYCGIDFWHGIAEDIDDDLLRFDEAWIYNTLQHVIDPERVIAVARKQADIIRIFEWIDVPAYDGHPHSLSQDILDKWLGGAGFVAELNQSGAVGRAYYGVFASA